MFAVFILRFPYSSSLLIFGGDYDFTDGNLRVHPSRTMKKREDTDLQKLWARGHMCPGTFEV